MQLDKSTGNPGAFLLVFLPLASAYIVTIAMLLVAKAVQWAVRQYPYGFAHRFARFRFGRFY
jgi:hypothetical protein